jgi:hypothetical protein
MTLGSLLSRIFPNRTQPRRVEYPHSDYPPLEERHLSEAKLFPSRNELIAALEFLRGGTIAEVGVGLGDFSTFLIETLNPSRFVAFDNFEMDKSPDVWGVPTSKAFEGLSHADFYKKRFQGCSEVVIEAGESQQILARYPDRTFDMIYVDANHVYEAVKADIEIAKIKIKTEGILVFNDYIMYDHRWGHYAMV